MRFLGTLVLLLLCNPAHAALAPERLKLGRFEARAIYTGAVATPTGVPAVLLIPGSGETGPEEMMPAEITLSGKNEPLLDQFASSFQAAGYATLQLGKPGVEFFADGASRYYDQDRYTKLTWPEYQGQIRDALEWLARQPGIDPQRIYVLGHSEGTQAAVDAAVASPKLVRGLFLLGFMGQDFKHTVEWQLVEREIDSFLALDADLDHDGTMTYAELKPWDDSMWGYQLKEGEAWTLDECRAKLHGWRDWSLVAYEGFALWQGIYARGPIYSLLASLPQSVHVFTGELDVQTPAREAQALERACAAAGKRDCHVSIVPGVGHGFSAPRGPKHQRLIDATLGPAAPEFLEQLRQAAVGARVFLVAQTR